MGLNQRGKELFISCTESELVVQQLCTATLRAVAYKVFVHNDYKRNHMCQYTKNYHERSQLSH